jgi:SAM-dependent methyltransferase
MTFMLQVRRTLKQLPVVAPCMDAVRRAFGEPAGFRTSDQYWKSRYRRQGNSGSGSYGRLAEFKAQVLNDFVRKHAVRSVIEWGCGDGNQQMLAAYPQYLGVDISKVAIKLCRKRFAGDASKKFLLYSEAEKQAVKAEMALSLDVIYHLVENQIFESHMRALTQSATRFIGIYSSDHEGPGHVPHVCHRSFSKWLAHNAPEWRSVEFVQNPYKYEPSDPEQTSWANFGFFQRAEGAGRVD